MLTFRPPATIEAEPTQRPSCPQCQMRMMTVSGPLQYRALECLRCGYTEPAKPNLKA
jgi:hypothetical protein